MAKGKFVQQIIEAAEKAGLDMSDAARMQRAKEQGFNYARASQSEESPINEGVGYAMFVEAEDPIQVAEDLSGSYGSARWVARGDANGIVDVKDIQKDIIKSLRERGRNKEYGMTAAAIARTANPEYIVNSAEFWDSLDLVSDIWEDVLDPKGIKAVRTRDGMIVFDDSGGIVRSADATFDPSKRDSGNYLAGAIPAAVGVGSLLGGTEQAQAMPAPDFSARSAIEFAPQSQATIQSPTNNRAALAAALAGQYNQLRRERLHPLLDALIPLGELPEDLWRKRAYGDDVNMRDYINAGIGML